MLKETIITIEDNTSAYFDKKFKIKQAPVLEMEKILAKVGTIFVKESKNINNLAIDSVCMDDEKLQPILSEIMKYIYFVDEKNNLETQLINNLANNFIEELSTLLLLRKSFIDVNGGFMKLVNLIKGMSEKK